MSQGRLARSGKSTQRQEQTQTRQGIEAAREATWTDARVTTQRQAIRGRQGLHSQEFLQASEASDDPNGEGGHPR